MGRQKEGWKNMENKNLGTLYFASPFFNDEQVEREERIKRILREVGFDVWSPKENSLCNPDASDEIREKTFNDNIRNILISDYIFVVTDGKDVGTIWEAGFAYGMKIYSDLLSLQKKSIIYYCETLPEGGKFNLMLAQSGDYVITHEETLYQLPNLIQKGTGIKYAGHIE